MFVNGSLSLGVFEFELVCIFKSIRVDTIRSDPFLNMQIRFKVN